MNSPLILYATETGNAQDVADNVARQCRRIALQCRVISMDKYSLPDLISEEVVIFVVSTTGSGVEPRSMTTLWKKLLRPDLPHNLFEDLHFAVFGLGDTAYEKFCWPAKKLVRRMSSLGAIAICERGEGDDQHFLGVDGALQPWMEKLLEALLVLCPLPPGTEAASKDTIPLSRVSIEPTTMDHFTECYDPLENEVDFLPATVEMNERITAEEWYQDVRHFEFRFTETIHYGPGDIAVICPRAPANDVETFLTAMNWGNIADTPFIIKQTMKDQSLPDHLPEISTFRTLFTRYLDFNAVPRRSFFQYLRYFTTDERERERLDEFLSDEFADELYEFCFQVRRTIQEVLVEFRHVTIPKEYIFDVFPPIRPRQFSIASSIKEDPNKIQLCIAIVRYRTKLKLPRRGLCTTFLAALRPGDKLRIGIQKGLLQLPSDPETPVICVGPGTGIAPMRSLIEERIGNGCLSNTLYFGCRSASKDEHYGKEWKALSAKGEVTYRAAYSRDGPEGVKRTYVQDLIREDAKRVWELLRKGAWVYISGSSNRMPAGVREAIRFVVETEGGCSEDDATKYVNNMVRGGRLLEECWS